MSNTLTEAKLTDHYIAFINNPSDAEFATLVAKLVEFKSQNTPEPKKQQPKVEPSSVRPKPTEKIKALTKSLNLPAHRLEQFKLIAENLIAIGVFFEGKPEANSYCTCWRVHYNGALAGLFLTSDWSIAPIVVDGELTGDWEGFDLIEFLDSNGVDVSDW